jgi:hypothetical protein
LLAERTQGIATRIFTYTAAGQLAETSLFTLTTRFTYNGDGARRVVNVVGRGATTYTLDLADGNRILAEQTLTGTTLYLYGHDCLGKYTDHWLYYLPDASGYVRQGTDSQGQVVNTWTYDPDGTVLTGPKGLVSHLVCGGVYDWSTGLIYKGGRYFDPSLGIWLALTPLLVVQSWRGRKRRRRGYAWYLVVLCVIVIGGLLVACGGGTGPEPGPGQPSPTCTDTPIPGWTPLPGWTPTPSRTPTRTRTPTPTPTPTPNLPRKWFIAADHNKPDNPKVIGQAEVGWSCSPTALFIVLQYWGAETDWNKVIAAVDEIPPENGGLDHKWRESQCPTNPVCTSLQVIEKVANDYANRSGLKVDAGENWAKEDIMRYIVQDIPVMVNYGGGRGGGTGHSLVAYGYDLDQGGEGTFWFINPSGGGTMSMAWNLFKNQWADSDYRDPRRKNPDGTYRPYHNWALALHK